MFKKIFFESIDSTNKYLKENYLNLDDKTVVFCNEQTCGKGRFNRVWEAKKEKDLCFSILLKSQYKNEDINRILILSCVATLLAIQKYVCCAAIKWPNDIVIGNKKVAGILIETIFENSIKAVIVGIGINVKKREFSQTLSQKATYIEDKGESIDIIKLLDETLDLFEKYICDMSENTNDIFNIYKKNTNIVNSTIIINDCQYLVKDISKDGALIVANKNGERKLYSGEISFQSFYERMENEI